MLPIQKNESIPQFLFCPRCGKSNSQQLKRSYTCPHCDFVLFANVAPATGALLSNSDGALLFVVRGSDPQKGFLDFPGGFMDPGETPEDGLRREITEELHITVADLTFFTAEPNIYPYRGVLYYTLDLFFTGHIEEKNFALQGDEIESYRFIQPSEVDIQQIAFISAQKAFQQYREMFHVEQ